MKKQLSIFLAGALVIIPFAITIWVIWSIGAGLDELVKYPLEKWGISLFPGVGALIVIVGIYLVGLATHFWVFQRLLVILERLVGRLPGIKTIYESVRDLLKLFGRDSRQMGRVVEYRPPGANMTMLGILTNETPAGIDQADGAGKVAVYLPLSYMVGGPTIYVSPEDIRDVDMPVEQALKICTMAQVGATISQSESQTAD